MARELTSLGVLGKEVPVQDARFLAAPSTAAPGTFDVRFMPNSAVTEMDLRIPRHLGRRSALVADIILRRGIGDLRVMTPVNSLGIAAKDQPPPEAIRPGTSPISSTAHRPAH
jgi:hypothetical protein